MCVMNARKLVEPAAELGLVAAGLGSDVDALATSKLGLGGGTVGRAVATLGGSVPPPKWLRPPTSRPPEQPIARTATSAHSPMRVAAATPNRPLTTSCPL